MSAINITLGYVAGSFGPFEHSVDEIAWCDARIRANPDSLIKVWSADDIVSAADSRRIGIIYGFQNAAMMGDDASRVALFARFGVKVIQLTYNVGNQPGDGSMVPENRGLSDFGRDVVAELNDHKVLFNLSHSGEQTCLDAIQASSTAVAVTHTGCRALADLPRNKTDADLRMLAERGGVVGIYFMPFPKVGARPYAVDDMKKYRPVIAADVEARKKAGVSASGESGDIVPMIPNLHGPGQFTDLADMLAARGISERVVDKILGENFLRLMDEVWSG